MLEKGLYLGGGAQSNYYLIFIFVYLSAFVLDCMCLFLVSLLDGRQESAASLKHQCDRIYIMKDEEVVDLKLDIKVILNL